MVAGTNKYASLVERERTSIVVDAIIGLVTRRIAIILLAITCPFVGWAEDSIIVPSGSVFNGSRCYFSWSDPSYNDRIRSLANALFGPDEVKANGTLGCVTYPYRGSGYGLYGNDVHAGIDLRTKIGRAVYAVEGGTVRRINFCLTDKMSQAAGLCKTKDGSEHSTIIIESDNQARKTLYLHLSEIDPKLAEGLPVVAGQPLGKSGSVGADHPHLHIEVWPKNSPVYKDRDWSIVGTACKPKDLCTDSDIARYTSDPVELVVIQPSPTGPENEPHTFDGEWLSPELGVSFRVQGLTGILIQSNSPKFKPGDVILRFKSTGTNTFSGELACTDGKFYPGTGTLRSDGILAMTVQGCSPPTWNMLRKPSGLANATLNSSWYSPEWKYGVAIKGNTGIITQSSLPNMKVGDTSLRITANANNSFEGEHLCTDGKFHPMHGTLGYDGRLYLTVPECTPGIISLLPVGALAMPATPPPTSGIATSAVRCVSLSDTLLHKRICELFNQLRSPTYFEVRTTDVSDELLFNYIAAHERTIEELLWYVNLGLKVQEHINGSATV